MICLKSLNCTDMTTVGLPPFATAIRLIKPECLVHSFVDQVHRCITLAGLNIGEGKTIGLRWRCGD